MAARALVSLALEWLNRRRLNPDPARLPASLRELPDPEALARAAAYGQARSRLRQVETLVDTAVVLAVLFSGWLPWACRELRIALGESLWTAAAVVVAPGAVASAIRWPVAWYRQFHLETQFGFNTMTGRLWWTDRLKSSLIGAVLAFLLALMLLGSMRVGGAFWWFWAWLGCLAAGVLLPLLLPSVILPWFNRFEPLSQGALRDRLLALAQRSGFPSRDILVTDGSRRSKHANAYLTGLGRSRRAVLFDTLLARLEEPEVEAVLAHEIAHHRCRHPQKGLALSALVALAALAVLSALRKQPGLSAAFGFSPGDDTALLVIAGFLAGSVLFWLAPLFNLWSRRQEFQADALAARWMGSPDPLVQALRKLTACNLDPLAPHPLYRAFHHSHPTLPEREQALRG